MKDRTSKQTRHRTAQEALAEMAQDENACQELKERIAASQREFEQLWLKISGGATEGKMRYRELRMELAEMRTRYARECGELVESSELPRSVTADWRG